MSANPEFPPLDGSVSAIPGLADWQVEHGPDRPWAVFPSGSNRTSVSYKEFADATHRVAHTFCPNNTRANGEVVALIIHCDSVLYLAALVGLVRAGLTPFPMSPKNSVPAFVKMLEGTSCHRVITQPIFTPLVDGIQAQLKGKQHDLTVEELPTLHDVFSGVFDSGEASPVEPFPRPTALHSGEDIVLYLHSSGSTGFPKPIPWRQHFILEFAKSSIHEESRKRDIIWGAMALPTFHTIGIFMQLLPPFSTSNPVGLYPPMAPAAPPMPTPPSLLQACKEAGVSGIPIVPVFIEAWAKSEESLKYLATLKHIGFSGGPVSEQGGAKLVAAGAPFSAVYGSTEAGVHTSIFDEDDSQGPDALVRSSRDWQWLSFGANVRCRWVPQGDGTYELQFLTAPDHHPAVENLPDVRGYATSDLFVPHPTKPGLWRITGRKDDVIVLSTGEKVVPIPQEGLITSSPLASGAVMFGRGRDECGILIEPSGQSVVNPADPAAVLEFRNKIWPVIEEANAVAPAYARIFKEMIIVTDPAKPLPRAAKGTVVRPQALDAYAQEIDNLYQTVADSADSRGIAPPPTWALEDIEQWLLQHCASINNGVPISPSRDFFDQGFDSLHATFLRNRIIGTLRQSADAQVQQAPAAVSPSFVFEHPTVRELASALASVIAQGAVSGTEDAGAAIQRMLDAYARHLPVPRGVARAHADGPTVLLTGSTGNLGAHVLAALLADTGVRRVYTLNRASASLPVAERQAAAFADRGLPAALLADDRLTQLVGDVTAAGFGLPAAQFDALKTDVTHVVHNAWRVDFNLALASFEKHVAGVRSLVDWAASLPHPPKLLFTSSVSAVGHWDVARGPVPDAVQADVGVSGVNGYGSSKFVVENLLDRAADAGLETTSLRIGQTCGSAATGAWGTSEWVPILVKSSVALGQVPDLPGPVSWIPLDAVAAAVRALVAQPTPLPRLLNVVHPRPAPWHTTLAAVAAHLGRAPLPLVPYAAWLAAVDAAAARAHPEDLERIPAIKILPFLRGIAAAAAHAAEVGAQRVEAGGLPSFETTTLETLPGVAALEPLGERHAEAWVGYWKKQGFLNI